MSETLDAITMTGLMRDRALSSLTAGTPSAAPRRSAADAMLVLYRLASDPATAGDALALLHELQVHQVEVDLQQEAVRDAQAELGAALARQQARLERCPAACVTVDARGLLCEGNRAGERLLGTGPGGLPGRRLADWLAGSGANALQRLLDRVFAGAEPEPCALAWSTDPAHPLLALAAADVEPGRCQLVLVPTAALRADAAEGRD